MKFIKKVSSVPLAQTEGHIIDSFNTSDDHTTNAPSLNAVETSVIMQPTILYDNTSGTTGSVTLSDNVTNYSYLEIYFFTNDGASYRGSQKVYVSSGTIITSLQYIHCNTSGNWWIKARAVSISGTSITNSGYIEISNGASSSASNNIYITKILGYK